MRRWLVIALIAFVAVGALTYDYWKPVPAPVKHPPNNDPWKLVSYDPDNPYGTYLGNGFISTRVMGDGVGAKCYMAGLYDNEKLIPTPTWSALRFYNGNAQFKIDKNAPYKQVLDMKTGILTTHATWRAGGRALKGKIEVIVSRALPQVGLVSATFTPCFTGRVRVPSYADVDRMSELHRCDDTPCQFITADQVSGPDDPHPVTAVVFRTKQSKIMLIWGLGITPRGIGYENDSISVINGKRFTIDSFASLAQGEEERNVSLSALVSAQRNKARFIAEHKTAWARLWKKDIIIDGPAKDQQAIHSCMFYLLQSVREGSQWSIPPMGLSNDSFGGHVFWDADIWIFPALILQHPELARSIVDYRFNTLPGAMANAKTSGYKGAEYAWESGYTGKEDTPPGLNYRHERHINGDVALAQWQYYLATGDNEWLKTRGFPVLKATADYWVSRVTYNDEKNRYEILKVVPPDENAEIINNSVYTNAIAKMNLGFAARAAQIIGAAPNPKWSEIADKMYIPFNNKAGRFIPFDDYKGFPAKQSDTELLIYPLQFKISGQCMAEIYKNTFNFYQPKVMPNGPAMSSSAHAVIAARLDNCADAYKYWRESYTPFLRGPFNYFNEKRSKTWEQMCFLTGAAGPVQSALFGLAGIQMDYDKPDADLRFGPCLPKQWKNLKVTGITWRGKSFDLLVEPGKKPQVMLN